MKILIIDDNQSVLRSLKLVLSSEFEQIVTMNNPQVIPALLSAGNIDAVLLDMNFNNVSMDGKDGLFWLSRIKELDNAPAVVMITAFGDVPLAVEAMRLGAEDFITKPWDNDVLITTIRRAVVKNRKDNKQKRTLSEAAGIFERVDSERRMTLEEIKLAHIRRVVDECGGNLSQAADALGINRQTLYNQLKKKQ